jgi:tRNA (adenine22-N1)-methyltransferase
LNRLPTLEPRLQAVLEYIRADSHADIGSDHAYLPLHLLSTGRVRRCLAVEKNLEPLLRAKHNAERFKLPLETRLGDGLRALELGEVSSLSFCGMGVATMVSLLERDPHLLEGIDSLVAQPNDWAEPLRRWAWNAGFWLEGECLASGFWNYPVLHFRRGAGKDPVYDWVPLELGLSFGPLLLKNRDLLLRSTLERQKTRLVGLLNHSNPRVEGDLKRVLAALEWLND